MFSAPLIDDKNYFQWRKQTNQLMLIRPLYLLLLPFIGIIFFPNNLLFTKSMVGLMILSYIVLRWLIFKNFRHMQSAMGNRKIEMDRDQIRIKALDGNLLESFLLSKDIKISIESDYQIPNSSLSEGWKEINGKHHENSVSIFTNNKVYNYFFEFNSYYMSEQLKGLVNDWIKKGYVHLRD